MYASEMEVCGQTGNCETPAVTGPELPRIRAIARTYRALIFLVGVGWLLCRLSRSMGMNVVGVIDGLAALVVAIVISVKAYRLACLLRRTAPVLWAIGIFVPVLDLVILGILSASAHTFCKRHRIRVGFFGPDMDDVARLEAELARRAAAS